MAVISGIKNLETYQPIHFGMKNGSIRDILFFQDNGFILKYEIAKKSRSEHKLFDIPKHENWKMMTRNIDSTTRSAILYEHNRSLIRIYEL